MRLLAAWLASTALTIVVATAAQTPSRSAALPQLSAPVNDLARVIDPENAAAIDQMSRALQAASGDAVIVATVPNIDGYATIEEYAEDLFENRGRGIGEKGKDNGVLIVMAMEQRRVRIEVGYALEEFITDGFAGETIREYMTPEFREGRFGAGLRAGAARIVGRIAQARGVTIQGVPIAREQPRGNGTSLSPLGIFILVIVLMLIIGRMGGGGRRRGIRRWGVDPWSGWSSGVGPFGGGWRGGGFGGGGFGGGFGGFGGGRSGGGGASGGW